GKDRQKLQRNARRRLPIKAVNPNHQTAQRFRFDDRGAVDAGRADQGIAKRIGRVRFRDPAGDGIAKDRPDAGAQSVCGSIKRVVWVIEVAS
ncbi:MAG: hypothetical protein ACI9TA_002387, partial [Reinekea sp.]